MSTKQLIAILGSVLLFLGVFLPIVSMPIIGSMNYFQNGKGDGVIVLVLAALSFVFALIKNYKKLWFTGLASLGLTLFTLVNFHLKIAETKAQMEPSLAGNPFRGLADIAIQSVQLQWGWAVLILGSALVITAAALKQDRSNTKQHGEKSKKCPFCAEVIKAEAIVCKHCGRDQPIADLVLPAQEEPQQKIVEKINEKPTVSWKSKRLLIEKKYAWVFYTGFSVIAVALFFGSFRIYYRGGIGIKIVPKSDFGYKDTIIDISEIRSFERFANPPEIRQQLIELGVFSDKVDQSQTTNTIDKKPSSKPKSGSPRTNRDNTGPSQRKESQRVIAASNELQKIKEERASAEKRLVVHETEKLRLLEEYNRRRDLYYQGLVTREEVLRAEHALAEATVRVDEERRFLAETDSALTEYEILNSKRTNR